VLIRPLGQQLRGVFSRVQDLLKLHDNNSFLTIAALIKETNDVGNSFGLKEDDAPSERVLSIDCYIDFHHLT
jgi:hypothetical protein